MPTQFFFETAPGQPAFNEEVCTQAFDPTRPYPQNQSAIIYRARFKQLRAYYTRPGVNAPHPNLPQVYFMDDVDFQDKTSGMIEWTRIYSTLPNSWDDYSSDAYTFPGLTGKRVPLTKVVTQKITTDYYLVGSLSLASNPTAQNRLAAFDDISNAAWTKTGATTPEDGPGPFCAGSPAASKLVESSATSNHVTYQPGTNAGGLTTGSVVGAVFIRAAERTKARVVLAKSDSTVPFADTLVDLSTGNITPQIAGNAAIAAIGEGWWRIALDGVAVTTNASLSVYLADSNGATNYAGDGASGFYVWRGQLYNGYVSDTSLAPTVPPTVTPDATNYPLTNAGNIQVKFGIQYVYNWSQNVAAEYLDGSTSPNINTYNTWVATDSNVANSGSYSIESADSTLSLWQGTIWQRQRHFVKAR